MSEEHVVIEGEHTCFRLEGVTRPPVGVEVPGTLVEWLDPEDEVLVVTTGAQFGPYAVTLRTLAAAPPEDASWEDVTELSVVASTEVAIGELIDGPEEWVTVAPGHHRVRVSARGRTESAERERTFPDDDLDLEDEVPLEHYLVEMWPAPPAPPVVVRETSRHAREVVDPPPPDWPQERGPGLIAAHAVAADVRREPGCRVLSGRTCDVRVSAEAPLTPTRTFNRIKLANGWPPGNGGSLNHNDTVGYRASYYADPPDSDGLAPLLGTIETEVLEIAVPKRFVVSWNWRVAGPGGEPFPGNPRLLPADSRVTMTFAGINGAGQEPRTLVAVLHSAVPEEWGDDLTNLWDWDLAQRLRL